MTTEKFHYGRIVLWSGLSFFKPVWDKLDDISRKTGGPVKGVCHPDEHYDDLKEGNMEWVRFDIRALPYDDLGETNEQYLEFKARAKAYADRGFKVMAITPFPGDYVKAGYDPRTIRGKKKIVEIAKFYAKDLQGIVSGFQIANEIGMDLFQYPLTLEEGAEFLGIQLEAMMDCRKDIIVGINVAGVATTSLNKLMKPYFKYCDYVAIDMYPGCFEGRFKSFVNFDIMVRYFWAYTGRPVLVNEFGYMSYGKAKTPAEKRKILQDCGADSEEEARANIRKFIGSSKFPSGLRNHLYNNLGLSTDEELASKVFDNGMTNHLYRELPANFHLRGCEHTFEGQALFFTKVIGRFKKLPMCHGAFVYCYNDNAACYICGQPDCPVETGWGLVDLSGKKKPAFYSVAQAFKNWK